MTISNKKILFALALLAPEDVSAFAIPSLGTFTPRALRSDTPCGRTVPVSPEDNCSTLAVKCNISQDNLIRFNQDQTLCMNLTSHKTVCCSASIQARAPKAVAVKKGGKPIDNKDSTQQGDQQQSADDYSQSNPNDQDGTEIDDQTQGQDDDQNSNADDNKKGNTTDGQDEPQTQDQNGDQGNDQSGNGDDDQNVSGGDDQGADQSDDNKDDGKGDDQGDGQGDGQGDDQGDGQGDDQGDGQGDDQGDGQDDNPGGIQNDNKNGTKNGNTIDTTGTAVPHYNLPGPRTGNWTKLKCNDLAMDPEMPTAQRWSQIGAPDAFKNAVDQFKSHDRGKNTKSLLDSVFETFGEESVNCSNAVAYDCIAKVHCNDFNLNGTGPAAMVIHNSFANIHNMFAGTYSALSMAKVDASFGLDSFFDTFAPIKPPKDDSKWVEFFLEIITMGATAGFGKIIKGAFDTLPALKATGKSNDAKSAVETLLGGAIGKLKDLNANKKIDDWDVTQQHDLKATFGEVFKGWGRMIAKTLDDLFASDDAAIDRLGNLINGGKMMSSGKEGVVTSPSVDTISQFNGMMFAVAAPLAWRLSSNQAFIIDTGAKCDAKDIKDLHLSQPDFQKLSACVEDKLYILAMVPDLPTERCPARASGGQACSKNGDCLPFKCPKNAFVKPPGADALDGSKAQFGNIKASDIVTGSVRTFKANGNKNGGSKPVDYTNTDSILGIADPASFPLPGMFRLPVCPPATAWKTWEEKPRTADNYPC